MYCIPDNSANAADLHHLGAGLCFMLLQKVTRKACDPFVDCVQKVFSPECFVYSDKKDHLPSHPEDQEGRMHEHIAQ
jgi:hypothetical protein